MNESPQLLEGQNIVQIGDGRLMKVEKVFKHTLWARTMFGKKNLIKGISPSEVYVIDDHYQWKIPYYALTFARHQLSKGHTIPKSYRKELEFIAKNSTAWTGRVATCWVCKEEETRYYVEAPKGLADNPFDPYYVDTRKHVTGIIYAPWCGCQGCFDAGTICMRVSFKLGGKHGETKKRFMFCPDIKTAVIEYYQWMRHYNIEFDDFEYCKLIYLTESGLWGEIASINFYGTMKDVDGKTLPYRHLDEKKMLDEQLPISYNY